MVNHPPLTHAEAKALVELAEHGPTRHLAGTVRGRLALYRFIDETPEGWIITALGREALMIEPLTVRSEEDPEKSSQTSPQGKRRYGKKPRNSPWIG